MTMEFTTVEKTRAATTYRVTAMLLQFAAYDGGILRRLSWVQVPAVEPFTYDQVQRSGEIESKTTDLFQATNKFAIQPTPEISDQVLAVVMDLAPTVNPSAAGVALGSAHLGVLDASDPISVGAYSNDVLDMLIERLQWRYAAKKMEGVAYAAPN